MLKKINLIFALNLLFIYSRAKVSLRAKINLFFLTETSKPQSNEFFELKTMNRSLEYKKSFYLAT